MDISLGDKISEGKTKCIHKVPGSEKTVYIVSKDSITAGDGAKKDVLPGKAIFSTTTTSNVFRLFNASGIATHYIKQVDAKTFEAIACAMVPLEVIVRRRVTGSYLKRNPHLTEGAILDPCVVEFTFKDDQNHDPLVTETDILAMKLKCGGMDVTSASIATMRSGAVAAFEVLEKAWALHDVVLVDFKVEFGVADGKLVLADVIDNDSWRIWPHGDRAQMKDKQVYRNIPKPGTAPVAVGTLNEEQQTVLVKNYEWVAEMSSRLLDVLGKQSHASSAPHASSPPLVGIIMGSQSDWETMQLGAQVLEKLGIPHEVRIVSAHRTPDRLYEYAKSARERGLHVIIAGAGGAAHLPGMVAALTPLPVLGVPVQSRTLSGVDSLLSIVQMPAGIPVGTLAIGNAGATNAALLAASILATKFPNFAAPLDAWRKKQTDDVAEAPTNAASSVHGHAPAPAASPATSILSAATRATSAHTPSAPVPKVKKEAKVLPPGSTIGILGGGQLGRMTAIAAAQLGYRVHVFCPEKDPPAAQVANHLITADYSDRAALDTFAAQVDVVTYEFENIDATAVEYLATMVPVRPDPKVLRVCQDRVKEKTFVNSLEIRTAPFAPIASVTELRAAVNAGAIPSVLKSNTLGYDGKGQVKITKETDLEEAWRAVTTRTGSASAILEGFVEFQREVSVIVARAADGSDVAFPVVENEHRNHILYRTTVPVRDGMSEHLQQYAVAHARRIAAGLELVGVIAVEMFVVARDGDVDVLVNELAPRPHNSGHWTIEGCATSQFEELVRAVCGLPLGSIGKVARCEMTNLIGKEIEGWANYVSQPNVHLHVYGKHEAREGRKMGHVTKVFE